MVSFFSIYYSICALICCFFFFLCVCLCGARVCIFEELLARFGCCSFKVVSHLDDFCEISGVVIK